MDRMSQYSGVEAGTYTISKVEAGTRMIRVRSVDAEGNRSMGIQKNVEVKDISEMIEDLVLGTKNIAATKNNPASEIVSVTAFYEGHTLETAKVALDGIIGTGEGADRALRTSGTPVDVVIDLGDNYKPSEFDRVLLGYSNPRTYAASTKVAFSADNVEYTEERNRGYDFREDLFVPGYFEFPIKKEESIIFSASVEPVTTARLKTKFQRLVEARAPRNSFENCLKYSASQFIVRKGKDTEVVAGYPWFGRWGRDTFIALPGVTLAANKDTKTCKEVLDTMVRELQNGLFPNIGKDQNASYNSVDAPMWFFKAVQEYACAVHDDAAVWKSYGAKMKAVLKAYREGVNQYVKMVDNYLIWADEPGKALTWMDAIVGGVPVTPRGGYQVEINALWYNAICYTLELARKAGDTRFVKEWEKMPELVKESFVKIFWNHEKGYLADFVNGGGQNVYVRPNQVIACSLEYSPISDDMKRGVLDVVKSELLTPKGLRTLAPKNIHYEGTYEGDQATRDHAYHQGTVWPWLIGPYIEANFRLYGKKFVKTAKELLGGFEEDMTVYGVCSIGEIYDGNPPYAPNGCISQAWSVGEILRCMALIKKYEAGRK